MFIVYFQKSHTRWYGDPEEMGKDIADFLRLHPKRSVKVEFYVQQTNECS